MLAGPGAKKAAAQALLAWYMSERRDLPWRRLGDPYSIWVSEIMLQQTQVDTVLGYYEAFLARFPDVATLAAAEEDDVLAAWSGLGYYRRARQLHAAARQVEGAGAWPQTAEEWRRLPGIGEYTAAAISSIAGGEQVAVLDGNVERALSRLLASAEDPKRAATRRVLLQVAQDLLVAGRAGDSNQALMELGATLCKPQSPNCAACPVNAWCAGFATGEPERYPPPRRRRASENVKRRVFLVARDTRYLLFQRAANAKRLAGFWELPWVEGEGAAGELGGKYGGDWVVGPARGRVRHTITHRRFDIELREADWQPAGSAEASPAGWFSVKQMENLATSSLVGKAIGKTIGKTTDKT